MAIRVTPEKVIKALYDVGVRPVLMGTYGLAGWRSRPRATLDVDVLVRKRDIGKAMKALQRAFPKLEMQDTAVVVEFRDPKINEVVIDLMKPTQAVFRMVFNHVIPVGETHDIPELEMGLISKFATMTSPRRPVDRKWVDTGDFANIVLHNRKTIDRVKLERLAEKVYPGGGVEVVKLVDDILAGREFKV